MSGQAGHAPAPVARELSAKEQEQEAKLCYGLHQNVVSALQEGRAALWKVAENLAEFEDHAGWSRLGYDTKQDWLADPDVTMTARTYRRLVRAWRVLHGRFQLDRPTLATLELSKVDIVLPAVEKGSKSLQTALDDIQTLGARDLRELYWGTEDGQAASPEPDAPEGGPGAEVDADNGSGPVRASDGAPVDAVFDHEGGDEGDDIEEPVDAPRRAKKKDLAPEEELNGQVYVRCGNCGSIHSIERMEIVAAPPGT